MEGRVHAHCNKIRPAVAYPLFVLEDKFSRLAQALGLQYVNSAFLRLIFTAAAHNEFHVAGMALHNAGIEAFADKERKKKKRKFAGSFRTPSLIFSEI